MTNINNRTNLNSVFEQEEEDWFSRGKRADYYNKRKITVLVPVEVVEYSNIGTIYDIGKLPTHEDVQNAYDKSRLSVKV